MSGRRRPLAALTLVCFVTTLAVPAPLAAQQPFTFTDSTLTAATTPAKAVHVAELRTAVNTMRGQAGLGAATFADPTLDGGPIKRAHIIELRAAIDAVYDQVGQTRPSYTDGTITAGATLIRRLHIAELRNAVNNGTASTSPSQLLTITGTGFDTAGDMRVVFKDANNRTVVVPAMNVTATTLRVTVPPVIDTAGVPASGALNVNVRKISGGTTTNSNTINGLQVSNLPTTPLAAGSVLKAILSSTRSQSLALKNEPVASAVKTQLTKAFEDNGQLLAKIQTVIDNPAATFTLGSAGGQTITIGAADLAMLDRLALSMIQALATQPAASPSLVGALVDNECMEAEAAAAAAAGGQSSYELFSPEIAKVLAAPRIAGTCQLAPSVKTGFDIVLGLGGIASAGILAGCFVLGPCSAATLALSGAALLYVTIVGVGAQIGLGGALNQTSVAAGQFVQNGLDSLEQELQELVAGVTKSGDFLSLYNDVKDLHNAITTNALPPYQPPIIPTVTGIAITQTGGTTIAVVTPVVAGVTVTYSLIGTDGYFLSGSQNTNAAGAISFGVPAGCNGVRDTITVNVPGGPSATAVHVWGGGVCGPGYKGPRRVPTQ
jgi:hypothetical protein